MRAQRGLRRTAALIGAAAVCGSFAAGLATGATADDAATGAPSDGSTAAARIERQLEQANDGKAITDVTPPPSVTAAGWLVYDASADEPVAAKEGTEPRPIASLAKLMTAAVVLDRLDLGSTVTVPQSVTSLDADAAVMGLRPGERWRARDLLRAMLVYSANDAALTLASAVSDGDVPAFVDLMNEQADELGLDDSEFASPTGLDLAGEVSVSTPVDLVSLALHDLADPDIKAAVAEDSITLTRPGGGESITLDNRNPLLGSYPGVDGVKTGFTDAAGYMLVVHYVDPKDDSELAVATFHSSSEATRVSDARRLLDWARTLRQPVRVVEGGTPLGSIPVQRSDRHVDLFACDDLTFTVRVGERLTQEVVVPRSVAAPVHRGDELGEIRVRIGASDPDADSLVPQSVPICSADSVPRQDRMDRLRGYAKDWRHALQLGVDEVEDTAKSVRKRIA